MDLSGKNQQAFCEGPRLATIHNNSNGISYTYLALNAVFQ